MKPWLALSSFFGLTAVILGALGAHALRDRLPPASLEAFKTGTQYQLLHAIALLALALGHLPRCTPIAALWSAGILLFSGSIYLLTCHSLLGLPPLRWLGPVTPLGGLLLILGWAWLLVRALRLPPQS